MLIQLSTKPLYPKSYEAQSSLVVDISLACIYDTWSRFVFNDQLVFAINIQSISLFDIQLS